MYDFEIFYHAAECLARGQSPYPCAHFFYPLPTVFLFLPLIAFPLPIAKGIWAAAMLAGLVFCLKRRALWLALSVPACQAAFYGQIDLVLLPAVAFPTGPGMALLTLKPQLVWLYLPFWFISASPSGRRSFLVVSGFLWGGSLLIYPRWPLDFLVYTRGLSQAAYASPSLWGGSWLPWPLVILFGLALLRFGRHHWAALSAVNPALIAYDLVILLPRARWWFVPLSWVAFYLSQRLGLAAPYVLLSIAVALYPRNCANPAAAIRRRWQALPRRSRGV